MKIIVIKFGGTSVGTLDRIVKISKIIISYIKKKYDYYLTLYEWYYKWTY